MSVSSVSISKDNITRHEKKVKILPVSTEKSPTCYIISLMRCVLIFLNELNYMQQ